MSSDARPDWFSAGFLACVLLGLSYMTLRVGLGGVATILAGFRGEPATAAIFGAFMLAAGAWLWSFFGPYVINALSSSIRVRADTIHFREGFKRRRIAARDLSKLSFCAISPQGWRYITFVAAEPCVITNLLYSRKAFDALSASVRRWAVANGNADCIVEDVPPGVLGAGGYRRRGRGAYLAAYLLVLLLAGLLLGVIRATAFPGVPAFV